jgi:hypothetical protein
MTATKKLPEADFMSLLQVSPSANAKKRTAWMQSRIIGLGHGVVCGRCCGTGHYSFNQINGSVCFGCIGTGWVAAKLTSALFDALTADVTAGKLVTYIEELRARQAITNLCKGATDTVMNAWSSAKVGDHYDWMKAAQGIQPHKLISTEVNKPMHDAYQLTCTAANALTKVQRKLRDTSTEADRIAIKAQIATAQQHVIATRDDALATIANAVTRLAQIQAAQTA